MDGFYHYVLKNEKQRFLLRQKIFYITTETVTDTFGQFLFCYYPRNKRRIFPLQKIAKGTLDKLFGTVRCLAELFQGKSTIIYLFCVK